MAGTVVAQVRPAAALVGREAQAASNVVPLNSSLQTSFHAVLGSAVAPALGSALASGGTVEAGEACGGATGPAATVLPPQAVRPANVRAASAGAAIRTERIAHPLHIMSRTTSGTRAPSRPSWTRAGCCSSSWAAPSPR